MTTRRRPPFLSDAELDANLDDLLQEVIRARVCWEGWWTLKTRNYRGKYPDVFAEYSEYFRVAIHSHFAALVLALWRLFDPANDAINLRTIRSRIGPRQNFPSAALRSYGNCLRAIDPLLRRLEIVRHKFLAHRDVAYTIERIFKEANLKYRDLATLVNGALELVNMLRAARNRGTYRFTNRTSGDLVRLVRCLHAQQNRPSTLRPLQSLATKAQRRTATLSDIRNGAAQGRAGA
jgi:AbiU2